MGLKPENPVVGGTVLRRAAIQSPNFVTGSAGWQINQDGSAEFNNVIIRNGQVVSGTALYYSGTGLPAANTLIVSISAAAGTDSAGNAYFAGFTTYGKTGLTYYALNQLPQADAAGTFGAVTTVYTAASQAGPWTAGTQLNLEASNHAALLADIAHIYGLSGAPLLELHSGTGLLSAAAAMSANAQGILNIGAASGLSGAVPLTQTDLSTHTAPNDGSVHDVTKTWTIPASDAAAGTIYTLKGHLLVNTGQTTIETLTLGIDLNGTTTALATLGTAFNGGALNTSYDAAFELIITADAEGADTPQVALNATLADLSANRLATNSANMHGHANGLTFTKSSSNTAALYAQWGGAGGSAQNAHTDWSLLRREGP